MPDADDFDVEYFRGLLRGEEEQVPDAKPKAKPRSSKPVKKPGKSARATSRKKGASVARRKKA